MGGHSSSWLLLSVVGLAALRRWSPRSCIIRSVPATTARARALLRN